MTPIQIEDNILVSGDLVELCVHLGPNVAIITDSTVEQILGSRLEKHLKSHDLNVSLFSYPGGECYKTRTTKEMIEDQMLAGGFGRDTCLIALGGGVTLDLAGFLASTYCRGIPYLSCPTSLMAMIDAAIGGKTGVNTTFGKNLIGTFYPPEMILIDLNNLRTLPKKEVQNGTMEMIKHGLIADADYFSLFEQESECVADWELSRLQEAIEGSLRIKQAIVKEDAHEKGKRRLLNFGHTLGHAIEQASHFEMPHGEAVAHGMILEARLSSKLGYLDSYALERIETVIHHYHPDLPKLSLPPEAIHASMSLDKKSKNGAPRFVLLSDIGSPLDCEGDYCRFVDDDHIKKILSFNSKI